MLVIQKLVPSTISLFSITICSNYMHWALEQGRVHEKILQNIQKGPSINYVSMILGIFDTPSPHVSVREHSDDLL